MPDYANIPEPEALTVTQLNRLARNLLEENFPSVLVEGEISNLAFPASGHWYLTLKDEKAQVRCAMFRNRNMRLRFRPDNGMQVLVKARLSIYEGRGDYQLILDHMEELGDGALRRAFDQLKARLLAEGLFSEEHKQLLPSMPTHVAIITSPTGAAIRDIITVLGRRFPAIKVTVLPVSVQGASSAGEMVHALDTANSGKGCLADVDLIIIGRGGGSLEDLWSFNDESLARAVFNSQLPVISAVGHEIDFTIADFVADLRAPTPSAAAELISPDQDELYALFQGYRLQLGSHISKQLEQYRTSLVYLGRRLQHPGRKLQEQAQRLDNIEARMVRALRHSNLQKTSSLRELSHRLQLHSPRHQIRYTRQILDSLASRLPSAIRHALLGRRKDLQQQVHALHTISPLATLARGYSITSSTDKRILRSCKEVSPGDTIITRLAEGSLVSTVSKSSEK